MVRGWLAGSLAAGCFLLLAIWVISLIASGGGPVALLRPPFLDGGPGDAAWIIASRRGEWDQLLAATLVTVAIALPTLRVTAVWEVYAAPHVLGPLLGYA